MSGMGGRTRFSALAATRSASAFRTHRAVSLFIQDLPLGHDFRQEPVYVAHVAFHFLCRAHLVVQSKGSLQRMQMAVGLAQDFPSPHVINLHASTPFITLYT